MVIIYNYFILMIIFILYKTFYYMEIKKYISNLVNECMRNMEDNALREDIRPMVARALNESMMEKRKNGDQNDGDDEDSKIERTVKKLMNDPEFRKTAIEYLKDEDAYDGWADSLNGKTYDTLDNMSNGAKRRAVNQRLKDEKIDLAPIAYEVWPSMSKDAARSWFYKKVDGKNESFSDEEVSKIYNLLNNTIS